MSYVNIVSLRQRLWPSSTDRQKLNMIRGFKNCLISKSQLFFCAAFGLTETRDQQPLKLGQENARHYLTNGAMYPPWPAGMQDIFIVQSCVHMGGWVHSIPCKLSSGFWTIFFHLWLFLRIESGGNVWYGLLLVLEPLRMSGIKIAPISEGKTSDSSKSSGMVSSASGSENIFMRVPGVYSTQAGVAELNSLLASLSWVDRRSWRMWLPREVCHSLFSSQDWSGLPRLDQHVSDSELRTLDSRWLNQLRETWLRGWK